MIFDTFDGPVGTLNESYESTESSDVIGQSIQARGGALERVFQKFSACGAMK